MAAAHPAWLRDHHGHDRSVLEEPRRCIA